MGAKDSYLSSTGYGYDYVLSVTQDSLSGAALALMNTRQPMVNVCYVYDDNGDPKQLDHAALVAKAHGTDPFALPAPGPGLDAAIDQLDQAGFMFGFHAALGLPEGYDPGALPPIVTLGATVTDKVQYTLLCRNFRLVELKAIPHKRSVLQQFDQPKGPKAGGKPDAKPWVFTYQVPLLHDTVTNNAAFAASTAFANIPQDVRAKVTQQPQDFTIKQLLLDFINAAAHERPDIDGVDRVLKEKLYEDFSAAYFAQLDAAARPVIVVTPKTGDDPLVGLQTEFGLTPSNVSPELVTLDYLCAAAGHTLPAARPFGWAWVDQKEQDDVDGVCALNRDELVRHLHAQLDGHYRNNRWALDPIYIHLHWDLVHYDALYGVVKLDTAWNQGGTSKYDVSETRTEPASGEKLLEWNFKANGYDSSALGSFQIGGNSNYTITVTCSGNVLTVTQHMVVYGRIQMTAFFVRDANLVDLTITDTFTLGCTHDGHLSADRSSKTDDKSGSIEGNALTPVLSQQFRTVQHNVRSQIDQTTVDVPLTLVNSMVFPGGKGFHFKEAFFSVHQDLVTHITYADPS